MDRCADLVKELKRSGSSSNVAMMARFGINTETALGVPIPLIRSIARRNGKDHALALKLWDTGIHEARILACYLADPKKLTESQMEKWVHDFDSWGVCDQVCGNLFDRTKFAYRKALEWSMAEEEYVKRAGFVMMAELAVHDKHSDDAKFIMFFDMILQGSADERNFVKKAVNWSVRQIGKRNDTLLPLAIELAVEIRKTGSHSGRWIATDALRELMPLMDR